MSSRLCRPCLRPCDCGPRALGSGSFARCVERDGGPAHHACPGAADTVERARLAARARCAAVAGLDKSTTGFAAEEAQREFIERSRAVARLCTRSASGGTGRHTGAHERRVQLLLTGVTPPRRSRVRTAAAVAAANSGPIGTTGIQSGEDGHRPSTDAREVVFLPPSSAASNGLC